MVTMLRSVLSPACVESTNVLKKNVLFTQFLSLFTSSSSNKGFAENKALDQEVMANDAEELALSKEILGKVNQQIESKNHGRLFAVVHISGRQHLIKPEDLLIVKKTFEPTIGDKIRFEKILAVGGKDFTLFGRPLLPKDLVNIEATVVEKALDATRIMINYRLVKKRMHFKREYITTLRVNFVSIDYPIDKLPSVEGVEGRTF